MRRRTKNNIKEMTDLTSKIIEHFKKNYRDFAQGPLSQLDPDDIGMEIYMFNETFYLIGRYSDRDSSSFVVESKDTSKYYLINEMVFLENILSMKGVTDDG